MTGEGQPWAREGAEDRNERRTFHLELDLSLPCCPRPTQDEPDSDALQPIRASSRALASVRAADDLPPLEGFVRRENAEEETDGREGVGLEGRGREERDGEKRVGAVGGMMRIRGRGGRGVLRGEGDGLEDGGTEGGEGVVRWVRGQAVGPPGERLFVYEGVKEQSEEHQRQREAREGEKSGERREADLG